MPQPISTHLVNFFVSTPPGVRGEAARYYLFLKIGFWIAAASHSSYALLFGLNGLPGLAWYNLIVTAAFAAAGLSWRRIGNPLWLMIPLWFIEIPFHAFLGTLYTGLTTLFWAVPVAASACCLITYTLSWTARLVWAGAVLGSALAICVMTFFVDPLTPLSTGTQIYFMVTNFLATMGGLVAYLAINQFHVLTVETKLNRERDRSESLLRNILPAPIAARLKDNPDIIADEHPQVTVLFADIVNFTNTSAKLRPATLVTALNQIFSRFDDLVAKHGVEKIKTIGDAYMVVAGMPEARENHADAMVALALDMIDAAEEINADSDIPLAIRIGINSGPVVAGVIGKNKFAYDLWGDTVNVAARMESLSDPSTVLITDTTRAALGTRFIATPDGTRDVKGKGTMPVFRVSTSPQT